MLPTADEIGVTLLEDGRYHYSVLVCYGPKKWTYGIGQLVVFEGIASILTFEMNQDIPPTFRCEEFSCAPCSGTYELKGDFTVNGSTPLMATGCKGDDTFEVPVLFSPHWLHFSRQALRDILTNCGIAAVTKEDEGAYCSGCGWDT